MAEASPPIAKRHEITTARYPERKLEWARGALNRAVRALGRVVIAMGPLLPITEFLDVPPSEAGWQSLPDSSLALPFEGSRQSLTGLSLPRAWRGRQASVASRTSFATAKSVCEPVDLPAVLGALVYPEQRGAVVRFTAVALGSEFMAAYPWSPEHGWSACN